MNAESKQKLLEIATGAVEAAVKGEPRPRVECTEEELQQNCGAFVTLKNQGRLRGCIGNFTSDRPLYQIVADMARSAAVEDFRFLADPITPGELSDIDIEISVISPLEKIDDPLDIELGTHGIYIRRGGRTGCFLPQVATETGWGKEEFLSHCCAGKAGLSPDAWKESETEVLRFTAEVFGEQPAPNEA